MFNPFTRLFAYAILERELTNRIADRDVVINELKAENLELRNRLFVRFGLPVSGQDLNIGKLAMIPAYRTGRQRVRDSVTPPIVTLSAEDEKAIEQTLTQ